MMSVERCFVLVIEGSVLKVSSTYFRITQSPFAIEFEVGIQTKIQLRL